MTDDPAPEDDDRSEFERFEDLTRRLVKVPKDELDKARAREAVEKAKRA